MENTQKESVKPNYKEIRKKIRNAQAQEKTASGTTPPPLVEESSYTKESIQKEYIALSTELGHERYLFGVKESAYMTKMFKLNEMHAALVAKEEAEKKVKK